MHDAPDVRTSLPCPARTPPLLLPGTIPAGLAGLRKLGVLRLGANRLSGSLDAFAGGLTDPAEAAAQAAAAGRNGSARGGSSLFDVNLADNQVCALSAPPPRIPMLLVRQCHCRCSGCVRAQPSHRHALLVLPPRAAHHHDKRACAPRLPQLTGPVPDQLAWLGAFNPGLNVLVPGPRGGPTSAPRGLHLDGNRLAGTWPGWLLGAVSRARLRGSANAEQLGLAPAAPMMQPRC